MSLSSDDRHFFGLVANAAFANPFTTERHEYDLEIADLRAGASREKVLDEMIKSVWERLTKLGGLDIREHEDRDRDTVELAVLFSSFHKFSPKIDVHIQNQQQAGSKILRAPFGGDVIDDLRGHGFTKERAQRFLSIFYQMRRAYYFIHEELAGEADSIQRLRAQLWNNLFTHDVRLYEKHLWNRMEDFSTLIIGATGTGKGTAAAAIGRSGWIGWDAANGRFAHSFHESFVPVNISQFSESLIESELFGHKKGAFTGAIESHAGVFQHCQAHGTIFLDEIGEMSEQIQIKMLRILQERTFSPVGSHETLKFQGRVVAATNRSIHEMRSEGRFRDDFYYRLCSDIIEVPTLRERVRENPHEIDVLVERIVQRILGHRSDELVELALHAIGELEDDYAWPGNVRELEQCVRRVVISRRYEGDRTLMQPEDPYAALAEEMRGANVEARDVISRYCQLLYGEFGTYEEVGRRTGLDRRTVKKYIDEAV